MKLSLDQIAIIREHINQSAISIDSLKDDILDHLCCVVEIKMERGKSFDNAVQEGLIELAPNGLDEIQHETSFLLNSTKIIVMKKFMYSIGLLSSIGISTGFLMKLLHLPGADEIVTTGLVVFGCIFMPVLAIDYFKMRIKNVMSEKLRLVFGVLSAVMISLGVTFKILHLFGADQLLIGGFLLLSFGFLPFLFFGMYKKSVS